MSRFKVAVEALPAQTLTAALGTNTLRIRLQWMARLELFSVSILTVQGVILTAGRMLLPGVDLLAGLYPAPDINYGSLVLEGEQPSPANLGVNNTLVWSND